MNKFSKKIDNNHQIDFLFFSTNLRANNFNIDNCSRDKAKFVSGNIVPSISTTNASIVGFISFQIFIALQTIKWIIYIWQINIDLSTSFILIFQTNKVYQNKDRIN